MIAAAKGAVSGERPVLSAVWRTSGCGKGLAASLAVAPATMAARRQSRCGLLSAPVTSLVAFFAVHIFAQSLSLATDIYAPCAQQDDNTPLERVVQRVRAKVVHEMIPGVTAGDCSEHRHRGPCRDEPDITRCGRASNK